MKKEEFKKITVEGKEYKLGFPTRKSAKKAEEKGLDISNSSKILTLTDKLFYTGLYSYQEYITENEAERIEEKFINEKGDLADITKFLTEQFVAFINPQNVQEMIKKKYIKGKNKST